MAGTNRPATLECAGQTNLAKGHSGALGPALTLVLGLASLMMLVAACGDGGNHIPDYMLPIDNYQTPTARPSHTGAKPPIIFVHGFRGMPDANIKDCPWEKQAAKEYAIKYRERLGFAKSEDFERMDEDWEDLGYDVTFAQYLSTPCYTSPYTDAVAELAMTITTVLKKSEYGQVILIAHSTGGLVARAYVEGIGKGKKDVAELVTLGTPYNGVIFSMDAIRAFAREKRIPADLWIANQHIIENFGWEPDKPYRERGNRNLDVRYHLLGGDLTYGQRLPRAWLFDVVGDNIDNDDGLVPAASALFLEGAVNYREPLEGHDKEYSGDHYFGLTSTITHHARAYILNVLTRRITETKKMSVPVTPLVIPVTRPGQTPQVPPRARCFKEDVPNFARYLKEYDIGNHAGEALGFYLKECPDIEPNDLILAAKDQDLKFMMVSAKRTEASPVLFGDKPRALGDLQLLTGVPEVGGEPVTQLPATKAFVRGDTAYIFGPITATTWVTLSDTVSKTNVSVFRMCPEARAYTQKDEPIVRTHPFEKPIFELLPGDEIRFERPEFPLVRLFPRPTPERALPFEDPDTVMRAPSIGPERCP
jgi:pimeloyl-ACP methyl ester carboxylesterase